MSRRGNKMVENDDKKYQLKRQDHKFWQQSHKLWKQERADLSIYHLILHLGVITLTPLIHIF